MKNTLVPEWIRQGVHVFDPHYYRNALGLNRKWGSVIFVTEDGVKIKWCDGQEAHYTSDRLLLALRPFWLQPLEHLRDQEWSYRVEGLTRHSEALVLPYTHTTYHSERVALLAELTHYGFVSRTLRGAGRC